MKNWWWIRHGPTHAKCMVGWTDIAADLSDKSMIIKLDEYLPRDAKIISSDLSRAAETASAIENGRVRLDNEFDLREFNFGDWDGKNWQEISKNYPKLSEEYWTQPGDIQPPNGESWNQSSKRINTCVDKINERIKCKNIIAVAHFGVILTQIQRAMRISAVEVLANKIDNFSVTKISHNVDGWSVKEINKIL
ncbi:MAG: histidine phosphatase family protein [Rhodobacteraceae bacterium]|nr:histidine phosphatase family protein [Paracoccaceae bacterium]